MVVGSTTLDPGKSGIVKVSVIMHEGMGGPHLFHVFIKSSDPATPVTTLKVKADFVSLEKWRHSHPSAFYLPRSLANFKLQSEIVGIDALNIAHGALGYSDKLKRAYVGKYREAKKETHLLIAEYLDAKEARRTMSGTLDGMKERGDRVDPVQEIRVGQDPVYMLHHGGREHFYFHNLKQVVVLSPDTTVARPSLKELLDFIAAGPKSRQATSRPRIISLP